jgi:uroporphyrinogen-III synthase
VTAEAGHGEGEGSSLAGLTVLVPRSREQAAGFSVLLRARGAEALEVPTIEIRQLASTAELDRAVGDLAAGRFAWVVLTSVNGVAAVRARAEALGLGRAGLGVPGAGPPAPGTRSRGPRAGLRTAGAGSHTAGAGSRAPRAGSRGPAGPARVGVAAVGPATEAALRDWGVVPDLVPEAATTAALGRAFPEPAGPGPGTVLLARADLANPELAAVLRAKGWQTSEVVTYHTVPVRELDPAARQRLDRGEVDWVAFTASSTVEGFLRGYGGPPPPGVRVAAIGPVTADAARSAGMRVVATAAEHTVPGLVAAIEHAVAAG